MTSNPFGNSVALAAAIAMLAALNCETFNATIRCLSISVRSLSTSKRNLRFSCSNRAERTATSSSYNRILCSIDYCLIIPFFVLYLDSVLQHHCFSVVFPSRLHRERLISASFPDYTQQLYSLS